MLSRIYGLPKVHKLGCPSKPVVSSTSSQIYLLSQQYDQMLKNILISIDFTSLYTNVSEMLVIEGVKKRYNYITKRASQGRKTGYFSPLYWTSKIAFKLVPLNYYKL